MVCSALQRSTGFFTVWQLDIQVPIQSVSITTKFVSSNRVLVEVYSIQHYVIKIVSDLRKVGGFLRYPPPIKLTTTIQLKYCESGVRHHYANPVVCYLLIQRFIMCTVLQRFTVVPLLQVFRYLQILCSLNLQYLFPEIKFCALFYSLIQKFNVVLCFISKSRDLKLCSVLFINLEI